MLFEVDGTGKIHFAGKMDASLKKESSGVSAMKKFQSLDRQARVETNDTSLGTLHQNAITSVCLHTGSKAGASKFSTAGVDGLLAIWDLKVSSRIKRLRNYSKFILMTELGAVNRNTKT